MRERIAARWARAFSSASPWSRQPVTARLLSVRESRYARVAVQGEDRTLVHQGKEFGVDLYELEKVAKADFPVISADYGDAIGTCDRVRGGVDHAMRRPDHFGRDELGPRSST
ncbi:hypothetical protein [Actinocrispum sp. NPDC049592]|uniref:hypothetical protein n=1 Tax=Actinocrispum sp. NPDC049592 TaxID=3154835 RepID=UPI00341B586A